MKKTPNIIAVVVTFNPDKELIKNNLAAISVQVKSLIIVDNSTSTKFNPLDLNLDYLKLISLRENMGIAYAQNIGIQAAIEDGADYILLLDQDSCPSDGMVSILTKKITEIKSSGQKIAAVAPICIDPRNGLKSYFLITKYGFPYRFNPKKAEPSKTISAGFLISSGTLINVACLDEVGGKRSNYFIDHVDTEWCFRARLKGYSLVGVSDAYMYHSIGDNVKKFWLFYKRNIPYHSPVRNYYMFRNTILTIRDVKGNHIWRLLLLYRLIQFMIYFLIFTSNRKARLKFMLVGLKHGILKIGGRLDLATCICTPIPKTSLDP